MSLPLRPGARPPLRPPPAFRAALFLALIAAGAHVTALAGGFVWDDFTHVDHAMSAPFDLRELFLPGERFRPFLYLPGGLDAMVWGERAAGWHLTTLLLHAGCAAALFLLLRRLLAGRPGADGGAVAGAALFAMHPATSEVASWIMARGDSLSLLFGLLSAHAAMSGRPVWMAGLILGALLAKETGVVWLALAPACAWASPERREEGAVRRYVPVALGASAAAIAYGVLRAGALRGARPPALSVAPADVVAAIGFYARAAMWPVSYAPYVEDLPVTPWAVMTGGVAIVASAAGVVIAARRKSALLGLALAGLWISLLPAVLTAGNPVSSNAVADRHLYTALPWLVLVVGIAWAGPRRDASSPPPPPSGRGRWAVACLASVLAGFASLSFVRDRVWHDERSLWAAVLRDAPESRYAWGNLGLAAAYDGDLEGAETAFRGAHTSRDPHPFLRVDTGAQLAMLLTADGRTEEARAVLDALRSVPTDDDGRDAFFRAEALLALAMGDPRAAQLADALRTSAMRRRDPLTTWHLARVLERRGEIPAAAEALALAPRLAGAASRGLARKADAERARLVTEP